MIFVILLKFLFIGIVLSEEASVYYNDDRHCCSIRTTRNDEYNPQIVSRCCPIENECRCNCMFHKSSEFSSSHYDCSCKCVK